jgi:hypothetical protein
MSLSWEYVAGFFDGEGCARETTRNAYMLQFTNTNLQVLEEIRKFVQAGNINELRRKANPRHLKCYNLLVYSRRHVVRIAKEMMPHLIVKKDKIQAIIAVLESRRFRSDKPTTADAEFADVVNRLYWGEDISTTQIAKKFNLNPKTIRAFMRRNNIRIRQGREMAKARAKHYRVERSPEGRFLGLQPVTESNVQRETPPTELLPIQR